MLLLVACSACAASLVLAADLRYGPWLRSLETRTRRRIALGVAGSAVLGLVIATLPWTAPALWGAQVERSAVPIAAAIERYAAVHGAAPDDLEQLVPEFLHEVPATGWPGQPRFAYLTQWGTGGQRDWSLVVWTGSPIDVGDDGRFEFGSDLHSWTTTR